jgi:hypothetical protein
MQISDCGMHTGQGGTAQGVCENTGCQPARPVILWVGQSCAHIQSPAVIHWLLLLCCHQVTRPTGRKRLKRAQDAAGAKLQEARDAREMAQQLFGADGGWGCASGIKALHSSGKGGPHTHTIVWAFCSRVACGLCAYGTHMFNQSSLHLHCM